MAHFESVPHFSLPILQNRCTFLFQNHQNVQRILIIGCSGAGKSTFARNLHDVCPVLELIHLDRYYWRPGWVETPKAEWEAIVKELAAKERFDGFGFRQHFNTCVRKQGNSGGRFHHREIIAPDSFEQKIRNVGLVE